MIILKKVELEDRLEIDTHDQGTKGQFTSGKPNSGKGSRLLQHLNTRISVGTEVCFLIKTFTFKFTNIQLLFLFKDGQYVYVDWLPQKEADSSKLTSN